MNAEVISWNQGRYFCVTKVDFHIVGGDFTADEAVIDLATPFVGEDFAGFRKVSLGEVTSDPFLALAGDFFCFEGDE